MTTSILKKQTNKKTKYEERRKSISISIRGNETNGVWKPNRMEDKSGLMACKLKWKAFMGLRSCATDEGIKEST